MPKRYRIRLTALEDGTVEARNEHGARIVMGPSGPDAFSPVELVLAALGGCSAMDFTDLMRKQRHPVAPAEIEVTAERAPGAEQRVAWARVAYRVVLDEVGTEKAERAARLIPERTCTVSRTLTHSCPVEHVVEPPDA